MAKRMKLSFSIDQILGLHETLKQEAAEEDEKERCTLKEERLDLASPDMDNRLTAEYRSPSLPSPGSDGFNDCSDDGKNFIILFLILSTFVVPYDIEVGRRKIFVKGFLYIDRKLNDLKDIFYFA